MGSEIPITCKLPAPKRDINARAVMRNYEAIAISKQYGFDYFDGDRKYGYGGYRYDGRWIPVALDIVRHYRLTPNVHTVLDIGCAKGFLVSDLINCAGIESYGLDISDYAVCNCPRNVIGHIHLGDARRLPFPDKSFDIVLAINVIHNFDHVGCIKALQEIQRVSRRGAYVQVDAYRTSAEREEFLRWVLTAETHGTPNEWCEIFNEAGYTGDYGWTII